MVVWVPVGFYLHVRYWELTLRSGHGYEGRPKRVQRREDGRVFYKDLLSALEWGHIMRRGQLFCHRVGDETGVLDIEGGREGEDNEASLPLFLAYLLFQQALLKASQGCLLDLGIGITG